ncbi:ATP-dependent DNA helicase RecG [Christensenellaceae bacterium OttesenSCG-928-M15]|nr:ATP-dependent DNA helicase RecG [Christensenellaceae bacterium OttesenSCG-928-M15]
MLERTIDTIKGIGPSRAAAFLKLQVRTLEDLLFLLPRNYEDFSVAKEIAALEHGELAAIHASVMNEPKAAFVRKGLSIVSAKAEDETGSVQLVWYNQPYRLKQIKKQQKLFYCGRADMSRGAKLVNPFCRDTLPGILPVYPLVGGLNQKVVRSAALSALGLGLTSIEDALPAGFLEKYNLMELQDALRNLHVPKDYEELKKARFRLAFEDMLNYLLAIGFLKRDRDKKEGVPFFVPGAYEEYVEKLPYAPTGAQARVLKEIAGDMQKREPMNRLVQGDVGAGKTVLAFFALYIAAKSGYQGALMAPTEILARQHYALLYERYGEEAVLLHGGMKKKEKEEAYARIERGEAKYIVGTHALLEKTVVFHRLGVVVADEQHRFGVRQRARLANKSETQPDVLIMSATPIPRTLSMLLYGDLKLSLLDELPPGRKPVMTRLVPNEKRLDMYGFIKQQILNGKQAYVVCPLVEQSDVMDVKSAQEVYKELEKMFPELSIGLLHGRLASAKKEEMVELFRRGEMHMLVSTTVIEVGVDVKNATVMAIENADRFGLAQLHQLRGRVGRGADQAYCFLLCGTKSETAVERMKIMVQTNNGFEIAQMDLELRGPGEFLGTRQHGENGLYAAKIAANMDVFYEAEKAANEILEDMNRPDYQKIVQKAYALYRARMQEIAEN